MIIEDVLPFLIDITGQDVDIVMAIIGQHNVALHRLLGLVSFNACSCTVIAIVVIFSKAIRTWYTLEPAQFFYIASIYQTRKNPTPFIYDHAHAELFVRNTSLNVTSTAYTSRTLFASRMVSLARYLQAPAERQEVRTDPQSACL